MCRGDGSRLLPQEIVTKTGIDARLCARECLEQGVVVLGQEKRILASRQDQHRRFHVGGVAGDRDAGQLAQDAAPTCGGIAYISSRAAAANAASMGVG